MMQCSFTQNKVNRWGQIRMKQKSVFDPIFNLGAGLVAMLLACAASAIEHD